MNYDLDKVIQHLHWLSNDDSPINILHLRESIEKPVGVTRETVTDVVRDGIEAPQFKHLEDVLATWCSIHKLKSSAIGKDTKLSESDTEVYCFLVFDLDRFTKKEINKVAVSATDDELKAIKKVADKITFEFQEMGFPKPLRYLSGNGYALLFPIDLPNTPDNKQLLVELSHVLAVVYDNRDCEIDTEVMADAARVLGLVGTYNRGHLEVEAEGRVHRMREVIGEYPSREPMDDETFVIWAKDYIEQHKYLLAECDFDSHFEASTDPAPKVQVVGLTDEQLAADKQFLDERALKYITKMEPPVEGHHGDRQTCKIANALRRMVTENGVRMTKQEVFDFMWKHVNPKCVPPWDADGLAKKVNSAFKYFKGPDILIKRSVKSESTEKSIPQNPRENAEIFAEKIRDKFCYAQQWKSWMKWDGARWKRDDNQAVKRRAMSYTKREMYDMLKLIDERKKEQEFLKFIHKSSSNYGIDEIIHLSEAIHSTSVNAFDANGDLFNVKNGTINLRDMSIIPHHPHNMITKLSPVVYDPSATCPTWEKFINRIFQDANGNVDHKVIRYIQKSAGYSMTASDIEQCLFILYGSGNNGKTTLIKVFQHIMGDFSAVAQQQLLWSMHGSYRANSDDVADLVGVRMAVCSETQEQQRLDEAKTKKLVGGGPIRAMRKFEHSFEFQPTHKIWMDCNWLPKVTGTDEGIWRRIRTIHFAQQIPPEERDGDMDKKLIAEASGILNWMLAGLRMYQAEGLNPPDAVVQASNEYRRSQDVFAMFLGEKTITNPAANPVKSSDIYASYTLWASENGIKNPMTQVDFSRKLSGRGFTKGKVGGDRCWLGLELIDQQPQVDPVLSTAYEEQPF